MTPGVALRWFAENKLAGFDIVIVQRRVQSKPRPLIMQHDLEPHCCPDEVVNATANFQETKSEHQLIERKHRRYK